MNGNDQHFFDLAIKTIASQQTGDEQAELESLLAAKPGLQEEFERLRADVCLVRQVLPLITAPEAQAGELPGYARTRLKTKVRQTLGKKTAGPQNTHEREKGALLSWLKWLGLAAAATAVVFLVAPLLKRPAPPLVQVALLDTVGPTRGAVMGLLPALSSNSNFVALVSQALGTSNAVIFSESAELKHWLEDWPPEGNQPVVKIVYDRDRGEVRVTGRTGAKQTSEEVFPVENERDLPAVLKKATAAIDQRKETNEKGQ